MPNKKIISALLRNHPGALQRVSGLFYRRGYNIETITACETENPKFSRATIVVVTDNEAELPQVIRQLNKLQDVRHLAVLDNAILSESMLIKFECAPERRTELLNLTLKNHASVVYIGDTTATITASGTPEGLNELLESFADYKIIEMSRSGLSAMEASDRAFVEIDDSDEFIN